MKKVFKFIFCLIRFAVMFIFISFIAVVCLQKFSNNQISIFNYRMFSVLTGSMEPDYQVGDILISKETNEKELKVGDDITYIGNANSFKDKTVTHRIIKIERDTDGSLAFFTKGTNNSVVDPVVKKEQIMGKVVYRTVILSALFKIVATKMGMFLLIIVPIMLIVITEIIQTLLEKETKKRRG